MNNPFSLDFGAEPNLFIPRHTERSKILDTFMSDIPSSHTFLLLGARGCGKTVLMTSVSHELRKSENWMHVDLSVEGDMLSTLLSAVYNAVRGSLPKVKIGVTVKGISITAESEDKYADTQTNLDGMMKLLAKHGIRLLLTIDEVINSKNVRAFTTYYQHCLREGFPVFVLMTGLYKNIRALENNKSQTFLKRAPKIWLGSLNISRIAKQYEDIFDQGENKAMEMARYTAGYSYAFQILGYLVYEAGRKDADESILFEYRMNLKESSYDKIWEELSEGERRVAVAIARSEKNVSVKSVRELLDIDSNTFSTYQDVLNKSGLLSKDSAYGRLDFSLPFFREYIIAETNE